MRPVLVVGAGLSGLACAFELRRRGRDVLVFEARERPGGVVGTLEADGFRFETGPNTLSRSASGFRRLCGELGVAERLVPSAPEARARYLWHAGELVPVPLGPCEFLRTPLISGAGKLRALTEPLRRRNPQAPELPEPSLAEFLAERLGPELTRRFAAPFVRGIYAGEIQRLGAESSFPRLWGLVQEHGGIARGLWRRRGAGPRARDLPGPAVPRGRLLSFRHGLRVLVDALRDALGTSMETGAPVRRLGHDADGWSVELGDGREVAGEALVLAVPAPAAARLLATLEAPATAPVREAAVATLRGIEHAHLTLVHLGLDEAEAPGRARGFGYLVPPDAGPEAPRVLGTIFVSDLFPDRAPPGCFGVTSFYRAAELESGDEERALETACEDLARAFGLDRPPRPRAARVIAWRDVIPQYGIGHAAGIAAVEHALAAELPGLFLAGCYTAGVSVEDVIARGRSVGLRAARAASEAHEPREVPA